MAIEREVKLRFESAVVARRAVIDAGAVALRPRRLQSDLLVDSPDGRLRRSGCALRVRSEGDQHAVTFKGPAQPSRIKVREEIETAVDDGRTMLEILGRLGFEVVFRSQKYREEYTLDAATIAIDETPMGAYVEIEGSEEAVAAAAVSLGRGVPDYIAESYRTLFLQHCRERNVDPGDMVFDGQR